MKTKRKIRYVKARCLQLSLTKAIPADAIDFMESQNGTIGIQDSEANMNFVSSGAAVVA
jgi:hypothetical protein